MDKKTQINVPGSAPQTPPPFNGGLYGRSENNANIKRTYIQGMKPRNQENQPDKIGKPDTRAVRFELQERPIAGILYSVSRDSLGEIYPVYVGRNTIGCEAECDIYLTEQTVSPNHAVLLVRMLPNSDGSRTMNISLTDYDSDFGTAVNGMKLGYDREPLSGNEIIQIGNSYQFLFVPLDASRYGLGSIPGFMSIPRKEMKQEIPVSSFYAPAPPEEIYPSVVGEQEENIFYGRTVAKKEDHSSKKTVL